MPPPHTVWYRYTVKRFLWLYFITSTIKNAGHWILFCIPLVRWVHWMATTFSVLHLVRFFGLAGPLIGHSLLLSLLHPIMVCPDSRYHIDMFICLCFSLGLLCNNFRCQFLIVYLLYSCLNMFGLRAWL